MSYSLDSLKGFWKGSIIGLIERETRSVDCSSYEGFPKVGVSFKNKAPIWVVLKIMGALWVLIILQQLIIRGTKMGL